LDPDLLALFDLEGEEKPVVEEELALDKRAGFNGTMTLGPFSPVPFK
jgi:hypothetical protein